MKHIVRKENTLAQDMLDSVACIRIMPGIKWKILTTENGFMKNIVQVQSNENPEAYIRLWTHNEFLDYFNERTLTGFAPNDYAYIARRMWACETDESFEKMAKNEENDRYGTRLWNKKIFEQKSHGRCTLFSTNQRVKVIKISPFTIEADKKTYSGIGSVSVSKNKIEPTFKNGQTLVMSKHGGGCKDALTKAKNNFSFVNSSQKEDETGCDIFSGETVTVIDPETHWDDWGLIQVKRNDGSIYWVDDLQI